MKSAVAQQRGNSLIVLLLILSVAGTYFALGGLSGDRDKLQRDQGTQAALSQAKQALIGFAATYRDSHPVPVFGFLPCPDLNNDGIAEASCGGAADISVIGRLPWRTLGLPPLRDSAGECLWYAVAGRAKDSPPTAAMNWDTTGQFVLRDAAGNILAGGSAHDYPLAVVFAPGGGIGNQNRASAGATECGGNNVIAAYLDGNDPIYGGTLPTPGANSTLTLATTDSIRNGTNNDQAQWISADDIFNRVRVRSDFAGDINALMDDLKMCLDKAASPPAPSGPKGFNGVYSQVTTPGNCTAFQGGSLKQVILQHWSSNFLYAKPPTPPTLNGQPCNAVLLFGGARGTGQLRTNGAQTGAAANYLEGANAAAFPNGSGYTAGSPSTYSAANPGADLARCITGLPAGSISFANDFSSFTPVGTGVTLDSTNKIVAMIGTGSTTGSCFWYPTAIPIAGKTLRAYYRYTFSYPDTHALTGSGPDRGNGFTFQLVRADYPGTSPSSPTPLCGRIVDMGALTLPIILAPYSFTIESDVRQDPAVLDPSGNHTAIVTGGSLSHDVNNGTPTTDCNATVKGCVHTPANKFEESPTPATHNQRVEIATGCNSSCAACNPAGHSAPNNYVRIRVWVDCVDCTDTAIDFPGAPHMQRCRVLPSALDSAYFGFTGGFRTGASAQGVTVQDLILFSQ